MGRWIPRSSWRNLCCKHFKCSWGNHFRRAPRSIKTYFFLWQRIVDFLLNAPLSYAFLSPSSSATLSPNYTEWGVHSPFLQTNRWYSSEKVESYVTFSSVGRTTKVNTADLLFNFSWPLGHKSNKNKKLALVKHKNNRKKSYFDLL